MNKPLTLTFYKRKNYFISPILEIKNAEKGLNKDTLLFDFITCLAEKYKYEGKKGFRHLLTARTNLSQFKKDIKISEIDRNFCSSYTRWLQNVYVSGRGGRLNRMTCHIYSHKLRLILQHAVNEGVLDNNPWNDLSRIEKIPEPQRMQRFLTPEELKNLECTPCKLPVLKSAFLFACYCGLRISDILKLEWRNINYRHKRFFLDILMQKTGKPLNVPLSKHAVDILPYRLEGKSKVFEGLPSQSQIQKLLKEYCASAGIKGNIHFHVSRHTFANLLITAGTDLYTISKLMGHSDVRATQIYAKIMDSKKIEAIEKLEKL